MPALPPHTTSLAKGLRVLDALIGAQSPLSVRALAAAAALPRSSAHRVASELAAWGALDRGPDGYQLGLKLFELGGLVPGQRRLQEAARPFMEDLWTATQRLVQIGVLDGCDVVYVARVGRRGHQVVATEIPGRVPATCTAMGKALLAHNQAAADKAMSGPLHRRTRHSITDRAVLRSELDQIRRAGIAMEHEEAKLGLVCVAAPVHGPSGAVEAAISLTGPVRMFEPTNAVSAVRATALGLGRALAVASL